MKNKFHQELFDAVPVIGIMRNQPVEHIDSIAKTYFEAGLTCLEITMNSPGVIESIAKLTKAYTGKLNVGAGAVCTMKDLDKALSAGAQFIVSPIINKEVIKTCVRENVPVFPGAYTPSEIYKAWHLGATMVKVFPAGGLGPNYIKEVLGPMEYLKLLPTGGIGHDNFTDYLKAGAKGVGIGGYLFPKDIINRQDWAALKETYKVLKDKVSSLVK
jgi:2-dehydro-3-deoxyphosphogluconate aldolase/(4S)-4-hydroxy-2-oxoglutarate aldolase